MLFVNFGKFKVQIHDALFGYWKNHSIFPEKISSKMVNHFFFAFSPVIWATKKKLQKTSLTSHSSCWAFLEAAAKCKALETLECPKVGGKWISGVKFHPQKKRHL